MKIKQKKTTLSCECGVFYTIMCVDYRVIISTNDDLICSYLRNTCCNKTNENKTKKKKTLSRECGVVYTIMCVDYRVIICTNHDLTCSYLKKYFL